MKKRILYIVPVLIFLMLFSMINHPVHAEEAKYNSKNLIASIEKENISLYYDKKADGMLQGFYLKIGNKVSYFDWSNVDSESFYPTVKLLSDKYIAITCTIGEGTGTDVQELYLINKKNLKKLTFESPLDVVKSNVAFDLQPPNVSVKIGDKTWSNSYNEIDLNNFFKTVGYESIIKYDVQNNYFVVTLSAQISPATFIGDLEIKYYYDKEKATFIPQYINFNFYETEIN